METTIRIVCFGDVVGSAGMMIYQKYATRLKREWGADIIVVNGENSASNGRGMTVRTLDALRDSGADMVTGGNHSFQQKEVYQALSDREDVLRPLNFPLGCPGKGIGFVRYGDLKIGVVNLQGRVFMHQQLDCPFRALESVLTYVRSQASIIIVDFHAEASSEKIGLAYYFDGKVSAVVGTHTHVQTADERILTGGTAFITDLGMAGALNSMIGMKKENVLSHMLTQMPTKFVVESSAPFVISGVILEIEVTTGKALNIERFRIIDEELSVGSDTDKTRVDAD